MAARRTAIRQWEIDQAHAAKIINRLKRFYMADPSDPANLKKMMTDAQVRAALGVLKKYKPDLKSIELVGNPDKPVITHIERVIVDAPANQDPEDLPAAAEPEPL